MTTDTAERLAHAWMTASFKTNEEAMDALLSLPNDLSAAPQKSTVLDMPLSPSEAPALSEGSRQAPSWELQTPNLRERWADAVSKARASTSPIERREWLEHALSITELLVSPSVCSCGVAYSLTTGRCEACDERHEQLTADRARFGRMALDVDERCGF